MVKTGADHRRALNDGRAVFIDGARVDDVTTHPAFRGAVDSICALYDHQAAPANIDRMTFAPGAPGTDARRANRLWQLPRNLRELTERRAALQEWAGLSCGMLGRSPDHVGSTLIGMLMGREVFGPARGQALADYVAYARDHDHYLAYVIINPQADRAKSAAEQPGQDLVARIVDEDSGGITIRGAKMLGTGAVLANELLVSGFMGLQAGEEDYAFTAVVPMNTKGLQAFSRRSYAATAGSVFDYPLSSRFDENDAVIRFDDVKIPWDRVFLHRDIKLAQAQWHDTRAHVMQNYQCQIRLAVKLRFLLGLARKIAEVNGIIAFPQVRETLGQLASKATAIEAMLIAMEAAGERFGPYYVPNRAILSSAQALSQELYPQIAEQLRTLAGGGLIMLPSGAADFAHPTIAAAIEQTQRSPAVAPKERVKFFKLAWDAIGSEFGSRHLQYEMFYSGPSFVTRGHAFRTYDWDAAKGMVDGFMATYDLA